MQDAGCRIQDAGYRIQDARCWMKNGNYTDVGSC
jgi:hypothetical protein